LVLEAVGGEAGNKVSRIGLAFFLKAVFLDMRGFIDRLALVYDIALKIDLGSSFSKN